MAGGRDPEEVVDLALEARGGIVEGGERGDRWAPPRRALRARGRTSSPSDARRGSDLERPASPRRSFADHEPELGPEVRAQRLREPGASPACTGSGSPGRARRARAREAGPAQAPRDALEVLSSAGDLDDPVEERRSSARARRGRGRRATRHAHAASGTSAQRLASPDRHAGRRRRRTACGSGGRGARRRRPRGSPSTTRHQPGLPVGEAGPQQRELREEEPERAAARPGPACRPRTARRSTASIRSRPGHARDRRRCRSGRGSARRAGTSSTWPRVWLTRWSIAANTPSGPSASPTHMSPVCSMLEYASSRL